MTEKDEDDEDGIRTLCDLGISIRNQGNSKSVMPSMQENGESAVRFGKIFNMI